MLFSCMKEKKKVVMETILGDACADMFLLRYNLNKCAFFVEIN